MSSQGGVEQHGPQEGNGPGREVTVYTRPGCPFCTSLRAGLRHRGLHFREVDIWQDPRAAATVRSLADGNETVPTVVIGAPGEEAGAWSAVNPSAGAVVEAAATRAPESVPDRRPGVVEGALNALGFRR